jgi:predicted CxxxxCH...CXXCH cytochrome family protein
LTPRTSAWAFVAMSALSGRALAIVQPPHDSATHLVECVDCHLFYADPRVARNDPALASGSAAAGSTATKLVDPGKNWSAVDWTAGTITFQSGANAGQIRAVTGNDATSITWNAPLAQPPAVGDSYQLGKITDYDVQDRCQTCHNASGQAPPPAGQGNPVLHDPRGGRVVVACGDCHEPHAVEPNSGARATGGADLIRASVRRPSGVAVAVYPAPGANPFIAGAPTFNGICEVCHTQTKYHRNDASGDHSHNAGTACTNCHRHDQGFKLGACNACHGAPPATGAHLKHFTGLLARVQYGDTRVTADFGTTPTADYIFGCGNCHPLDMAHHMDGIVDVELYNAAAPAGSLKANAANGGATYTRGAPLADPQGITYSLGTCGNIYCHSGNGWTTPGGVPEPSSSGVYPPYTVVATRSYRTIGWGDPNPGCAGCHDFPPRTFYPQNAAGAGDSHSFIDPRGYEDMHDWNMGYAPLQCRTCHRDTVTDAASAVRDSMDIVTWTWDSAGRPNAVSHADGQNTVRFDTVNPTVYDPTSSGPVSFDLSLAGYDPASHSCTNVGCHLAQTTVTWGSPYRWENSNECNSCHGL